MLTVNELLLKRYKVIEDYPNSIYTVNEIMQQNGQEFFNTVFFEKYPNIFKELAWYEERSIDDLPEYVSYISLTLKERNYGSYLLKKSEDNFIKARVYGKVFEWQSNTLTGKLKLLYLTKIHGYKNELCESSLPATRQEYEGYIKTKLPCTSPL